MHATVHTSAGAVPRKQRINYISAYRWRVQCVQLLISQCKIMEVVKNVNNSYIFFW